MSNHLRVKVHNNFPERTDSRHRTRFAGSELHLQPPLSQRHLYLLGEPKATETKCMILQKCDFPKTCTKCRFCKDGGFHNLASKFLLEQPAQRRWASILDLILFQIMKNLLDQELLQGKPETELDRYQYLIMLSLSSFYDSRALHAPKVHLQEICLLQSFFLLTRRQAIFCIRFSTLPSMQI